MHSTIDIRLLDESTMYGRLISNIIPQNKLLLILTHYIEHNRIFGYLCLTYAIYNYTDWKIVDFMTDV